MIPLYLDFETLMTSAMRLDKMTLRQYLAETHVTFMAWALGDSEVKSTAKWEDGIAEVEALLAQDDVYLVAYNLSFDARVYHYLCGRPYPDRMLCAMELAYCAWPNQPGGYSLANMCVQLGLTYQKMKIDFATASQAEIDAYCRMDVEVLRELFKKALTRVPVIEQRVCALSNRAKQLYFEIDTQHVLAAVENLSKVAGDAAFRVATMFDDPAVFKAYGWHGAIPEEADDVSTSQVKSVKSHVVKHLLLSHFDIVLPSISVKKINPTKLAAMPEDARKLVQESSQVNKALSHKRNLKKFAGMNVVDCELTYAAAHTLRFSSRNQAKGLNLHNMPKHNKEVAEPVRKSFRLPDGWLWVRGDFANVEYRIEGLLSGCAYVEQLFTGCLLADPYVEFGKWATGILIDKNTPAGKALRQLFKAAVLGLGFIMGMKTWFSKLMEVLASKDITVDQLTALAQSKGWLHPSQDATKICRENGYPLVLGAVGEKVHHLFHARHPEFKKLGKWLEKAIQRLSYTYHVDAALEELYALPGAPPREIVELVVDRSLGGTSVRAHAFGWPASVCWRDLAVRTTKKGPALTSILAGSKPPRNVSINILLENLTQHAARCALVKGQLQLEEMGHKYQISIHDEVFIAVPADREAVLKARQDLLTVFGPGNALGYSWGICINPAEVTVSRSFWDDEKWSRDTFWPALLAGDNKIVKEVA